MTEERVQKILARAGFGSRRSCEEYITSGRVRVNGLVVNLGTKADAIRDTITVDGRAIKHETELIYIALHKPRMVLSDEQSMDTRKTVLDLVQVDAHLFPVGRLDFESEGLILLTNDGELANRLTHPRYGHEKEYRVLVATRPDAEQLATWRRGVVMEDGYRTQPARVEIDSTFGKGTWLRVILREGKKRQIREVGTLLGLPVVRILRVRIGSLLLGNLKSGEWRHLTPQEVTLLKSGAQLKPEKTARPKPAFPKSGSRKETSGPSRGSRSSRPTRSSQTDISDLPKNYDWAARSDKADHSEAGKSTNRTSRSGQNNRSGPQRSRTGVSQRSGTGKPGLQRGKPSSKK